MAVNNHPVERPGEELTGDSEALGGKQWGDLRGGELGERPGDDLLRGEVLFLGRLCTSANLIQDFRREPCLLLVAVGNTVDCRNGLVVPTFGDQELGRFEQLEEAESTQPEDHGDGTQSQNEVPPTHVVGSRTGARIGAGIIGDVGPGKHTDRGSVHWETS